MDDLLGCLNRIGRHKLDVVVQAGQAGPRALTCAFG
jgi:hypothetical protein